MNNKIILIDHHDNPGDDRVAIHLDKTGFELDLRCPFKGDALPDIDDGTAGAVIYGGAQSVGDLERLPFLRDEIDWIRRAIKIDLPLLGICLGAQLIAHTLGAKVRPHKQGLCEFGYYEVSPTENAGDWFSGKMLVTQAHYEQFELPDGAVLLATGKTFPNQAFRYQNNIFALQFHPEVTADIFKRWQNSDWAFFNEAGAQTREEQDAVIRQADPVQEQWFHGFLDRLFLRPAISH
ncbi:MAG: glutamine amidotransferase [Gammaproteobacteria bacterium]|nr:glutamine amidotransferase [Gammaproteobacteria bacterium]